MLKKKTAFLLATFIFSLNVFAQPLLCQLEENEQLCNEIGQMLIIGFGGFKQDDSGEILWDDQDGTKFNSESLIAQHIANNHIGGVILFLQPARNVKTGAFIRDRNIQSPAQVTKLNEELQNYSSKTQQAQGLEALPLFVSIDQEGGRIDRLPAVQSFPVSTLIPQALGTNEEKLRSLKSPESCDELFCNTGIDSTYEYASNLTQELYNLNFNLNFAPVADVNINPLNKIIGGLGRSFSADPEIVAHQAEQFIKAFHAHKIIPTLKHFPGHGSSVDDSHAGLVDVTNTYQKEKELYPYRHLIESGYDDMIMTTHVINGQLDQAQCKDGVKTDHTTWCPGTMSKTTLTKLLRDEMNFKGIIVSDDMTMGAITEEYGLSDALKNGVNAGVDIFIIANNYEDQTDKVINTIVQLVKSGDIKPEIINDAYSRIVNFKKNHIK